MKTLTVILIISALVFIHEFGHYIVARAFGMRVLTFSIGFGPSLFRWRPKGSETVFQVAAIPVLAYVQIAGMSPREETDRNDRGSYQNATPLARFLTIAAGPLANFLAAGLVLFIIAAFGGEPYMPSNAGIGRVSNNSAAAQVGLRTGDIVHTLNGQPVANWESLVRMIAQSQQRPMRPQVEGGWITALNDRPTANWYQLLQVLNEEMRPRPIALEIERDGRRQNITVTPRLSAEGGRPRFMIGIAPLLNYRPMSVGEAARAGIVQPAVGTGVIISRLGDLFRSRDDMQLMGPVGIVTATVQEAEKGWRDGLEMIAAISLQLFIFNLLPIPALDGGRLIVLGYEMITRRRPNPRIEARVLGYSLMLMLGLFLVVTSREIWGIIRGLIGG